MSILQVVGHWAVRNHSLLLIVVSWKFHRSHLLGRLFIYLLESILVMRMLILMLVWVWMKDRSSRGTCRRNRSFPALSQIVSTVRVLLCCRTNCYNSLSLQVNRVLSTTSTSSFLESVKPSIALCLVIAVQTILRGESHRSCFILPLLCRCLLILLGWGRCTSVRCLFSIWTWCE